MIPPFAANARRGELIRPPRFLPAVDWAHEHKSFAFGPWDVSSGTASPDMSRGNYATGWVAYAESDGGTYLQKKMPNDVWDDNPRYLLALVGGIQKIGLEFSPAGNPILAYLRPDNGLGVWWRNPITGFPQLLDLSASVQDMVITVENKDDQENTDVFLWYFRSGSLYLRRFSDAFAVEHGPYVTGATNPVIIQAGINHRYGYQIDYRENP